MLGENVEVMLSAESTVLAQHTTPKHNLKKCRNVDYLPKTIINMNEIVLYYLMQDFWAMLYSFVYL